MPPISATPPTMGGSGMVSFFSTVTLSGPRPITFSQVV